MKIRTFQYRDLLFLRLVPFFFIFCCLATISCSNHDEEEVEDGQETVLRKASYNILAIGNSFTNDGIAYLPNLIEEAGLKNVMVAKLVHASTSLEFHYENLQSNNNVYNYYESVGSAYERKRNNSILGCLENQIWDVIVLQQVSQKSGSYNTYQPYLNKLLEIIHEKQPEAEIAWHMTWAYGSKKDMFDSIRSAVIQMQKETKIRTIIPSGITIQNLRNTSINDELGLTRDGAHLNNIGRYAASCTWFETFFSKKYGISVKGNIYRIEDMDNNTAEICQQQAVLAVEQIKETLK